MQQKISINPISLVVACLYQMPCVPSLVPQRPSPLFPISGLPLVLPEMESPQAIVFMGTISVPSGATGLVEQSVMEGGQGSSLQGVKHS